MYHVTPCIFDLLLQALITNTKREKSETTAIGAVIANIENKFINDWSTYHNYASFVKEMQSLKSLCYIYSNMMTPVQIINECQTNKKRSIYRVRFGNSINNINNISDTAKGKDEKLIKVLIVSGMHNNEVIGTETCLNVIYSFVFSILRSKYKHEQLTPKFIKESDYNINSKIIGFDSIFKHFIIDIVPLVNPDGRFMYEVSDFNEKYERFNSNNIDINRNFDWNYDYNHSNSKNCGNFPFSEIESRYLRDIVIKNQYDMVIDIHSGTKCIGMFCMFCMLQLIVGLCVYVYTHFCLFCDDVIHMLL